MRNDNFYRPRYYDLKNLPKRISQTFKFSQFLDKKFPACQVETIEKTKSDILNEANQWLNLNSKVAHVVKIKEIKMDENPIKNMDFACKARIEVTDSQTFLTIIGCNELFKEKMRNIPSFELEVRLYTYLITDSIKTTLISTISESEESKLCDLCDNFFSELSSNVLTDLSMKTFFKNYSYFSNDYLKSFSGNEIYKSKAELNEHYEEGIKHTDEIIAKDNLEYTNYLSNLEKIKLKRNLTGKLTSNTHAKRKNKI